MCCYLCCCNYCLRSLPFLLLPCLLSFFYCYFFFNWLISFLCDELCCCCCGVLFMCMVTNFTWHFSFSFRLFSGSQSLLFFYFNFVAVVCSSLCSGRLCVCVFWWLFSFLVHNSCGNGDNKTFLKRHGRSFFKHQAHSLSKHIRYILQPRKHHNTSTNHLDTSKSKSKSKQTKTYKMIKQTLAH